MEIECTAFSAQERADFSGQQRSIKVGAGALSNVSFCGSGNERTHVPEANDFGTALAWQKLKEYRFRTACTSLPPLSGGKWRKILMNKVVCCVAQIGVLVVGLACGAPGFAQEPGFPPETSAPPPKQGPSGGHHGMMDPDEQLARMTTRYSLTTEQQNQVKPILVSRQHQIQALRQDTALSREDRMAKMQTIRSDSDAKVKAVLNDDQKKQFEQDQLRMQKRMFSRVKRVVPMVARRHGNFYLSCTNSGSRVLYRTGQSWGRT